MSHLQDIIQEIETLPIELQDEVFDFILFLKSRHSIEEEYLKKQIEAALAHRREHLEEEQVVTAEEWLSLTEHLDERTR